MNEIDVRLMGRKLRLAVVRQQYEIGNLTEAEAIELLSGPLTPGVDTTVVDDSALLKVPADEALTFMDRRLADMQEPSHADS
jgi:hypothetical protein